MTKSRTGSLWSDWSWSLNGSSVGFAVAVVVAVAVDEDVDEGVVLVHFCPIQSQ